MKIEENVDLSNLTTFGTGGKANKLITIEDTDELEKAPIADDLFWFLGSGANVLISDEGLPGTVIKLGTKNISVDGTTLVADGGVKWDSLVQKSIEQGLWGLERTSGIPGTVGAAVVGNIAAYGQAVSDTLKWVEVFDFKEGAIKKIQADELDLKYRYSKFQTEEFKGMLIIRAAFELQKSAKPLEYKKAIDVAEELALDSEDLQDRRKIILEARRRAGSLVAPDKKIKTAGSFFKNPIVSEEVAESLSQLDEFGVEAADIKKQNEIHGGSTKRVSASHVLLAAGFNRGQSWGPVRLHPDHILKIENTGGASSQQIYNVQKEIVSTVKEKLGITLKPEVRFLGNFN